MNIPILILIFITAVGIGIEMQRHGKKKEGKYSIWTHLIAVAITWVLILWALGWKI